MGAVVTEHVAIDVRPGVVMESQSGLQNLRPRIFGVLTRPAEPGGRVATVLMHPTSNYMGHYLREPLAERGIACLALNSRYVGNDALLQMERVIQDLGAGIGFLRARGYRRVYLIGNSGGASLSAYYQSQAERFSAAYFVDGDPTGLSPSDLPTADGIVLSAAHLGRSRIFLEWLDPALVDEADPFQTDSALDLYDGDEKPPYATAFLARFRAAQKARRDRLEAGVRERLGRLRSMANGPADQFFIIHRTHADPRFLDLTLDSNDRPWGSIWGDPRTVNYAANAFGRLTSHRAFLSQLSSASPATGPGNLAQTTVPVLLMVHTADGSTYPSTRDEWLAAAPGRIRAVEVKGGDHYLVRQPAFIDFSADTIKAWTEQD
jgi:pimeloyl-ACP methyl ester carboxylesterase